MGSLGTGDRSLTSYQAVYTCVVCHAGSIQAAWQQGDRAQRTLLLNSLVRVLQNISEEEAQALSGKDPERPGLYDKLCNTLACCGA